MTEAIRQGDIPGVQLRRRLRLSGVGPDVLWRWLTETDRLCRWLADEADVVSGERGRLRLAARADGEGWTEVGETVGWRPQRSWTLRFRRPEWSVATLLEIEIGETADGVELSVLQSGFEQLPLSDGLTLWEAYRRRWSAALARLERAISVGSAPAAGD